MGISREVFPRTPQVEFSAKKDLAPYTITIPVADTRAINRLISRWQDKEPPKYDESGDTLLAEQRLYSYGSLFAIIEGEAYSSPVITVCAKSRQELEAKFHLLSNLLDSYALEIKQEELGNLEHITVSSKWMQQMIDASPVSPRKRFPRIISSYTGKQPS